jgi:hypothetical protein
VGDDRKIDRKGLEQGVAHGFCIVRWRVDQPQS